MIRHKGNFKNAKIFFFSFSRPRSSKVTYKSKKKNFFKYFKLFLMLTKPRQLNQYTRNTLFPVINIY